MQINEKYKLFKSGQTVVDLVRLIQSALQPITNDLRATHQVLGHRYVAK